MNDFMGSCRLVKGRKLAGRGWKSFEYVEVLGSAESSLSCLLWTHKNLPETEFVFLTATLIALEQLPSKRSNKPVAIERKCYLPNV